MADDPVAGSPPATGVEAPAAKASNGLAGDAVVLAVVVVAEPFGGVVDPSVAAKAITEACSKDVAALGVVGASAVVFFVPALAAACSAAKDKVGAVADTVDAPEEEEVGARAVVGMMIGWAPACPRSAASA